MRRVLLPAVVLPCLFILVVAGYVAYSEWEPNNEPAEAQTYAPVDRIWGLMLKCQALVFDRNPLESGRRNRVIGPEAHGSDCNDEWVTNKRLEVTIERADGSKFVVEVSAGNVGLLKVGDEWRP